MATPDPHLELLKSIDSLTREEMARIWRFAPLGDPMLMGEVGDYFVARFTKLGGFSPEISKKLGWDEPSFPDPAHDQPASPEASQTPPSCSPEAGPC